MLATLENAKSYLNIDSDASKDAFLTGALVAGQGFAENYCQQPLEEATIEPWKVHKFTGDGYDWQTLPFFPVSELVQLRQRQNPISDYSIIDDSLYGLDESNGIYKVYYSGIFVASYNYELQLKQGYTEDNVPDDLRQIIIEMAAEIYDESGVSDKGMKLRKKSTSQRFQAVLGTESFKNLFDDKWELKLQKYRVPTV